MNNSVIQLEPLSPKEQNERNELLREREATLVRIIEAIQEVKESRGWSTLKAEIFDSKVETLKKEILQVATKMPPDAFALARLAGELADAEKYADLDKLASSHRVQLQGVRLQLHGKTE